MTKEIKALQVPLEISLRCFSHLLCTLLRLVLPPKTELQDELSRLYQSLATMEMNTVDAADYREATKELKACYKREEEMTRKLQDGEMLIANRREREAEFENIRKKQNLRLEKVLDEKDDLRRMCEAEGLFNIYTLDGAGKKVVYS